MRLRRRGDGRSFSRGWLGSGRVDVVVGISRGLAGQAVSDSRGRSHGSSGGGRSGGRFRCRDPMREFARRRRGGLSPNLSRKRANICARRFPQALLLFTSSTSVYAQRDGEWVTEESAAEPDNETGRILRTTEELILDRGGIVARLGGNLRSRAFRFVAQISRGHGGARSRTRIALSTKRIATISPRLWFCSRNVVLRIEPWRAEGRRIFNVSDNHPHLAARVLRMAGAAFAAPASACRPQSWRRAGADKATSA